MKDFLPKPVGARSPLCRIAQLVVLRWRETLIMTMHLRC